MRWPQSPEMTVQCVMAACTRWLTKHHHTDLLTRLPELVELEERYRAASEAGQLLALLTAELPSQRIDADKKLLGDTYDKAFVGGGGRKLYDAIKAAATFGCSICGAGQVSTLDHHAPKAVFPLLALTPLNLVPACGPCNQGKGNSFDPDPAKEPFHPYFDDLGLERWLYAEIQVVAGGPVVEFSARPPQDWPAVKAQRLIHHVARLRLGTKLRAETARHLAGRRRMDMDTLGSVGSGGLKAAILEEAGSYGEFDPNDWMTALLYGLADCDWYLTGGMKGI